MYNQFLIFCVALAASATLTQAGKCSDHLLTLKSDNWGDESTSYDFTACSAVFSTFERHLPQVHGLINEHIGQSFLYSIMSSHFETDSENRLGFGKYLDSLADSMWSDAIDLVKYAGKRGGGVAPLIDDEKTGLRIADLNAGIKPWTEVEALALVYDHHNSLAGRIHQLHASTRDTAFSDYLEGRFVSNHVDRIRQLAGYMTNLVPMYQEASGSDLALYLFDQSLV